MVQQFTINNLTYEFVKKNFIILILVFITSLAIIIKGIVFPIYLGKLIPALKTGANVKNLLISTVLIYVGFNICISFHEYTKMILKVKTQPFYINFFCNNILDNLENEFIKSPESVLYSNIVLFSDREDWYYDNFIRGVLPLFLVLVGINIYLYKNDTKSGFIFTSTIIIFIMTIYFIQKYVRNKSKIMTCERDNIIKYSEDLNKNIDSILSFGKIDEEKENITLITEKFKTRLWDWMSTDNYGRILIMLIFTISGLTIIYHLYKTQLNDKTKTSFLISFILIFFQFVNGDLPRYVERIQSFGYQYGQKKNYLEKINEYLRKSLHNTKIKDTDSINLCKKCILNIQNINYSYLNGKNVFLNFNLKFYENDVTALIGSNGSGKSTLLKILFGNHKIESGNIFYKDLHINKIDIRHWREYFHYGPQFPKLFNRTIDDNISYGNNKKTNITELIDKFGLQNLITTLSVNNRKVGAGGENLSGGQRQIISLLRIISNLKPIVLLDEPTSALDIKTKKIVYQMIEYLKTHKVTIIIVTHDKELIKRCNRLITLSNGKIIMDERN